MLNLTQDQITLKLKFELSWAKKVFPNVVKPPRLKLERSAFSSVLQRINFTVKTGLRTIEYSMGEIAILRQSDCTSHDT